MDLFIKDMKELVIHTDPGPYRFKQQFSGRVVPFTDFVKRTPAEKEKLKRSFHSVAVCLKTLRKVLDFKPIQQT